MNINNYQLSSDAELIPLIAHGDHLAYSEIYNRYKGILHTHAYKKLGDFEEAKDVVQELFVNIWNKRESIPQAVNFSGYLYSSLRNRILNIISHKQIESRYSDSISEFFLKGVAITDHLVRERELSAKIEREIDNLPPKMREVFILSRKEHLSHKEISQLLSISEHTVKNQIKNALKILRIKLGLLTFIFFLVFFR